MHNLTHSFEYIYKHLRKYLHDCIKKGLYTREECHIDLGRLASFAGARLIVAEACGMDLLKKNIKTTDGRPPINFDVCSINIGIKPSPIQIVSEIESVNETIEHAQNFTPVKPISMFSGKWDAIIDRISFLCEQEKVRIAIIGGGGGGVELAFAVYERLHSEMTKIGKNPESQLVVSIYAKHDTLMPSHNREMQGIIQRLMLEKNINVLYNAEIDHISKRSSSSFLVTKNGDEYPFDEAISCTSAQAPEWLQESGLETTKEGFICVKSSMESTNIPGVFASGDVCHVRDNPRPKAGVFAVRAGPSLLQNLKCRLLGEVLQPWIPQNQFLGIIGTGNGYAVSSKGPLAVEGAHQWRLKDTIDREWMRGYQELPDMSSEVFKASGIDLLEEKMTILKKLDDEKGSDILVEGKMRCGGCGSKIGSQVLTRAIKRVRQVPTSSSSSLIGDTNHLGAYRKEVVAGVGDDAAILQCPTDPRSHLVQTIDYFRSFISDPYLFGKIAANHALSDTHAMNGNPVSALALCVLPYGREEKVENDLTQMIAGACSVLKAEGCALVGGHSSEGAEIAMGLSCHAIVDQNKAFQKGPVRQGDILILTKAIGTGVLLAADMRAKAKGRWIEEAFQSMTASNGCAAKIFCKYNCTACTDVTGFGLIGHLLEMLQYGSSSDSTCHNNSQKLAALIAMDNIPVLTGAKSCIQNGVLSSLHAQNVRSSEAIVNNKILPSFDGSRKLVYPLLFDPQTAGGLLACIPHTEDVEALLKELKSSGYNRSAVIGRIGTMKDFINRDDEEISNYDGVIWLM